VGLLLVSGLTAVTAAACGGAKPPAAEPNSSGVYGTVKRGPLEPVCERGTKCYGPAKNATLAFVSGGKTVARVITARDGSYRIALPSGRYTVSSKLGIGGIKRTHVRVPEGKFVRLSLVIDTGIR